MTELKRKRILDLYGDMRISMNTLMLDKWRMLGKGRKEGERGEREKGGEGREGESTCACKCILNCDFLLYKR